MDSLTNGTEFAHLVSTTDCCSSLFPAVEQRLEPMTEAKWWGRFAAGDELLLSVKTEAGTLWQIEMMDETFRHLSISTCSGAQRTVHVVLARTGIVYFRFHNRGGADRRVRFELVRTHGGCENRFRLAS